MTNATTLGELAVAHPAAARVFYSHRLDFCCGGRRSFADACRERGLDATAILEQIQREDPATGPSTHWGLAPLATVVDHIVHYYHARLRETLPHLVHMARTVEAKHQEKVSCPIGLAVLLEQVHRSVLDHLEREETVLFPAILRQTFARLDAPVHILELEHEQHKSDLLRIRVLTNDLTPPIGACSTWLSLYAGLQHFEQELMEHIHLENNVLFRRALAW